MKFPFRSVILLGLVIPSEVCLFEKSFSATWTLPSSQATNNLSLVLVSPSSTHTYVIGNSSTGTYKLNITTLNLQAGLHNLYLVNNQDLLYNASFSVSTNETEYCAFVCPNDCSGHGICDADARTCTCDQKYSISDDCSIGLWVDAVKICPYDKQNVYWDVPGDTSESTVLDWITVAQPSGLAATEWAYLSGTKAYPPERVLVGSFQLWTFSDPGAYTVIYNLNDRYVALVTTNYTILPFSDPYCFIPCVSCSGDGFCNPNTQLCECEEGFHGRECEIGCNTQTDTLTDYEGVVSDGTPDAVWYASNSSCAWHIAPAIPATSILLKFTQYEVAEGDVITIYAGEELVTPIATYSGFAEIPTELVIPAATAWIEFESDTSTPNGRGFEIKYSAQGCLPGNFLNETAQVCQPCPIGTYNEEMDQYECQLCPPGRYSNTTGLQECAPCEIGTFTNTNGSTSCELCPVGTFTEKESTVVCAPCMVGYFANGTGHTSCNRCPLGTYADQQETVSCTKCPSYTTTQFMGAANETDCLCSPGYWRTASGHCEYCPEGGICKGGVDMPYPIAGYWSSKDAPYLFYECISEHICLGKVPGDESCTTGRTGRMCSMCKKGYYVTDSGCGECKPYNVVIVILFGISLAIFCIVLYFSVSPRPETPAIGLGASVAIIINYTQMLSAAGYRSWPNPLPALMNLLGTANLKWDISGSECFSPGLSDFETRFIFRLCAPMILAGGFVVLYALSWIFVKILTPISHRIPEILPSLHNHYSRLRSKEGLTATDLLLRQIHKLLTNPQPCSIWKLMGCVIIVMDIMYLFTMTSALQLFQCYPQPDGSYSLTQFPEIECFSSRWWKLMPMTIFAFLAYSTAFPILCGWAIAHFRRQTDVVCAINLGASMDIKEKYQVNKFWLVFSSLFQRYQAKYLWWSSVVFVRKLFLAMKVITFSKSSLSTNFFASICIQAALLLQLKFTPFRHARNNRLEFVTLFLVWCLLLMGMLLESSLSDSVMKLCGGVMVALISFGYLFFAHEMYKTLRKYQESGFRGLYAL